MSTFKEFFEKNNGQLNEATLNVKIKDFLEKKEDGYILDFILKTAIVNKKDVNVKDAKIPFVLSVDDYGCEKVQISGMGSVVKNNLIVLNCVNKKGELVICIYGDKSIRFFHDKKLIEDSNFRDYKNNYKNYTLGEIKTKNTEEIVSSIIKKINKTNLNKFNEYLIKIWTEENWYDVENYFKQVNNIFGTKTDKTTFVQI